MENNLNDKTVKKIVRVAKTQTSTQNINNDKKIIRKVVKVIPQEEMNTTNLKKEINTEKAKREEQIILQKLESEKMQKKKELEIIAQKKIIEKQMLLEKKEKIKKQKQAEKEKRKIKRNIKRKKFKDNISKALKKDKVNYKKLSFKEKISRVFKICFFTGFFTFIAGIIVIFLILKSWCKDIPTINTNELKESALTSYIYDTNGDLITTYSSSENREWVKIEDIPKPLLDAFVNIEDKRFYSHKGVDAKRLISAILGQLSGKGEHGGSTITQQLIKNVYLTNEVTYKRKVQEIVLAFELEKQMTKDEILEAYVNIIYFGSSNYGVSAAAHDYFGKDLKELSLREMAMLAGIPKNPNGYNPRTNTFVKNNMSKTNERTDNVLWVMKNNGVITEEQYAQAIDDTVVIKESSSFFEMYKYAHSVEYAINDVIDDLLEQRGLDDNYENRTIIDSEIRKGGYSIYTTIDPVIEKAVQETVSNYKDYPYIYDSKGEYIKTESGYEKPEVASVVINPSNGYILAMIGSRDEISSMKTYNRAISNNMPIASSIKPLSIYGPSLEKGLSPGSVEYNFKTYIEGYDKKTAFPGGESPESVVTMRDAVANSYNISAARFLCKNIGYDLSEAYLLELGINKQSIQKNGSGLALGTSGINILELTAAYQSFANGGYYNEPKAYKNVIDKNGDIILESKDFQIVRKVFSTETAWLMTDMLKNTIENGTAYKAYLPNVEAAGKTGTHDDKCSIFAGYTGEYVSAIWVGSDSFSSMSEASGGKVAAPIWKRYLEKIYSVKGINKKTIYEEKPESIEKVTLCSVSGKIATNKCSDVIVDYVNTKTFDYSQCDLHVNLKTCAFSGQIAGEDCPEEAIVKKTCLFVPLDSELHSIPESIIHKYYPDAVIQSVSGKCNSHINGIVIPSSEQVDFAKNLNSSINTLKKNALVTGNNLNVLNNDSNSLSLWIERANNALNGATETPTFYNEFFAEYNRIKTDVDNIKNEITLE